MNIDNDTQCAILAEDLAAKIKNAKTLSREADTLRNRALGTYTINSSGFAATKERLIEYSMRLSQDLNALNQELNKMAAYDYNTDVDCINTLNKDGIWISGAVIAFEKHKTLWTDLLPRSYDPQGNDVISNAAFVATAVDMTLGGDAPGGGGDAPGQCCPM